MDRIFEGESDRLMNLEEILSKRIVGRDAHREEFDLGRIQSRHFQKDILNIYHEYI